MDYLIVLLLIIAVVLAWSVAGGAFDSVGGIMTSLIGAIAAGSAAIWDSTITTIRGGCVGDTSGETNSYSNSVSGGATGAAQEPIDAALALATKFNTESLTFAIAKSASDLADDIVENNPPSVDKKPPTDTQTARAIADSIAQYFIYTKSPSTDSRDAIAADLKIIKQSTRADTSPIATFVKILGELPKSDKESHDEPATLRDCHRRYHMTLLASAADPAEITRLKMELREATEARKSLTEELERMRARSGLTSSLSKDVTTDLLAECNRERRLLQERIYDLRNEITRAVGLGSGADRGALERCMRDKAALEAQVTALSRNHSSEHGRITALERQLRECESTLNDVLVQTG